VKVKENIKAVAIELPADLKFEALFDRLL